MRSEVALAALVLSGCTLLKGQPPVSLQVSLAAQLPSGPTFTNNLGYVVRIDEASFHLEQVGLTIEGTTTGTTSGDFDPSNPPPGCTLCHGGHCHCGDRLVSYEELSGGTATASRSVPYPGPADLDALHAAVARLPDHPLPEGAYTALAIPKAALHVRGRVSGGSLTGEEAFTLDLPGLISSGFGAQGDLELSAEREPVVKALLSVTLPSTLLDDVEFSNLEIRSGARLINPSFAPTDVARMRLDVADHSTATLSVSREDDIRFLPPAAPAWPRREEFGFRSSTPSDGGTSGSPDAAVDPNLQFVVDGCEHLNEGPDLPPVTAADALHRPDAGADPVLPVEHGQTAINLIDYLGQKGGVLAFTWAPVAVGSRLWLVMEQESVPLEVRNAAHGLVGATVDLARGSLPGNCGSEPRRAGHLWVYDLPAGTYSMTLGPTLETAVTLVAVDSLAGE